MWPDGRGEPWGCRRGCRATSRRRSCDPRSCDRAGTPSLFFLPSVSNPPCFSGGRVGTRRLGPFALFEGCRVDWREFFDLGSPLAPTHHFGRGRSAAFNSTFLLLYPKLVVHQNQSMLFPRVTWCAHSCTLSKSTSPGGVQIIHLD
jgi:hypothetical protein